MSHPVSFLPKWGAWYQADGTTRFRIWAPHYEEISVVLEDGSEMAMSKDEKGWHETCFSCQPGVRYSYKLSPDTLIPDPASQFQPDDVHGKSAIVDQHAYQWRTPQWLGRPWEETVIYELHVGTCGGYSAIIKQLDALSDLGITAIELMPLSEFPGSRNWGYDGVFPYAPESSYGSPNDLKALIDAAHERHIMVFLDVVYNHFGPEGNVLSQYIPEFFSSDRQTAWGQAINFTLPAVQDFFLDNALYWLNIYHADGLRLDAVHAIAPQSWLQDLVHQIRARCHPERHIHFILENENNDASLLQAGYSAQWNDDAHNALHVLLTGETEGYYGNFAQNPTQDLVLALQEGFVYQGQISPDTQKPRGQPSADLSPTSFIFFLQNHDQIGNRAVGDRLSTQIDSAVLSVAHALLLLSPHIPMLFMGEEWGTKTPFLYFVSHSDDLNRLVREGRQKEMAAFSAFNSQEKAHLIPDPASPETFRRSCLDWAERSQPEHAQIYETVKKLIAVRQEHIVPRLRNARAASSHIWAPGAFAVSWRMGDDRLLELFVNFSDTDITMLTGYAGVVLYRSDHQDRKINHTLKSHSFIATLREGSER